MAVIQFRHRAPPPPIIAPSDNLVVVIAHSALNLTVPTVIKAGPGRLSKLIIIDGGTDGAFMLNDCAVLADAAAANTILTLPFGAAAGTIFDLDWPCATGIVLSAVPVGGVIAVSYS
jgi:hypothetical protein